MLPSNRKPSSAMAWLILILIVPLAASSSSCSSAGPTWTRPAAPQREADEAIRAATEQLPAAIVAEPPHLASMATLNYTGSLPFQDGNLVDLFPDYRGAINAMAAEVETATSTVEVEFYIAAWDDVTAPVFEALEAAVARGVKVRMLIDHMGSRSIPEYAEPEKRLTAGHRLATDASGPPSRGSSGRTCATTASSSWSTGRSAMGSQNLIEPGYNKASNHKGGREYVELVARIDGPAVSLRAVFAKDWYTETHETLGGDIAAVTPAHHDDGVAAQILLSGPGYVTENNLRLYTALIYPRRSGSRSRARTSSLTSRSSTP